MPETVVEKPAQRPSTLVVTGETRQAFMDHRMDIVKPPAAVAGEAKVERAPAAKAEPAKAEPAKADAPAPAAAEEVAKLEADLKAEEAKAQPDEKKKQGIRERISEITEQKKTAQAEAAKERARAEKAERELAEERAKAAPPPAAAPDEPKAPNRAEFATQEEYDDARVSYRVKVELAERDKAAAAARAKAEGERVVTTYGERLRAAKTEIPDFDARIEKAKDLPLAPHVRDAIFESEVGPRVCLYFADHPQEAERINKLAPAAAMREFGKIEAMIETSAAAPKAEPKPEAKPAAAAPIAEISKAPPPIAPLKAGAGGESEARVDGKGNFVGTYAEYRAARKAGKIK